MQNETEVYRWAGRAASVRETLVALVLRTRETKTISKALVALADYPEAVPVCVEIVNRGTKREHVVVGPVILV